jgi:predicted small integral membrane protein
MDLSWMAWTWQTAAFFAAIAALVATMTALAALRPETPRVGALGLATTRGDRLFVSLLGGAFIHLAWLGLGGDPAWVALALSLAFAAAAFRWA